MYNFFVQLLYLEHHQLAKPHYTRVYIVCRYELNKIKKIKINNKKSFGKKLKKDFFLIKNEFAIHFFNIATKYIVFILIKQ